MDRVTAADEYLRLLVQKRCSRRPERGRSSNGSQTLAATLARCFFILFEIETSTIML